MRMPKAFEAALADRADTIWLDYELSYPSSGKMIERIKEAGAGIYLERAGSRAFKMTHMYRSPTHPDIVLTHISSATGKGNGQQICEKDEPAFGRLIEGYERLMARNHAMEDALAKGQSAAFGFMVHPILLLRPGAAEDIYNSIMSRDSRIEIDGERIIKLFWKGDDYTLQATKNGPPTMRIAGKLPETAKEGLMAKQHVRLSELIDHNLPRKVTIKKIREIIDTNFAGRQAIELQLTTDFMRLAPIPPEYDGDWSKPKPGKRY